jgi:predicted nucleic acid-binding protein
VRIALDADVLIGALEDSDPHHTQARRLFVGWERRDDARLISVVNLTEVLIAPAADRSRLRTAREAIAALGVAIHKPGEAIGVEAARLRNRYPISLPDAYCLATARHADAQVASFDEKVLHAADRERLTTIETRARQARRR